MKRGKKRGGRGEEMTENTPASSRGDTKIEPTDKKTPRETRKDLKVSWRKIEELIPYAANARTHSEDQVAQIAASIQEIGWTNPILVDETGNIIAGHGRLLAAVKLGKTEAPCIELRGLTEAQRKAYIVMDNQLALNAGWDMKLLAAAIEELDTGEIDLNLLGFSSKQLDAIMTWAPDGSTAKGKTDQDAVPVAPEKATTRKGDLWILDKHLLLCGDSTAQADMTKLMQGQEADMVWTDPPYNVDYHGGTGKNIMNDNMTAAAFERFLEKALKGLEKALKKGGCFYIAHADIAGHIFRTKTIASGLGIKQCLIWVKNSVVLGQKDYNWKHEPILYGWKPGAAHYFSEDYTFSTVIDDDTDLRTLDKKQLQDLIHELRNAQRTTVIRANRPTRSESHPTMKPVALVEVMIKNSSRRDETVLDPFGGSGTTLIACEKHGRRCRMMELDPIYADVIVRRWQDFTGKRATLAGTKKTYEQVLIEREKK